MKKLLTVLCMIMIVLTLGACTSNQTQQEEQPQEEVNNEVPAFVNSLLTKDTIIVATSPDYPPFESLNAQGEAEGFDIDALNEVIKILNEQNGTNLKIELKQMDFSTIISAAQANQIDMGVSAFTYNPERDCDFSTPYLYSAQVIVTRNDTGITCAEDLAGKKVAAGTGTTGDAAAQEIEGVEMVYPGDYTVMFQTLQAGQIDAVVCDKAVGENYVKEMGLVLIEPALVEEDMSYIF